MVIEKGFKISTFQRIKDKFHYRLVRQSLRNLLSKIGIDIRPFYWVREGVFDLETPQIKGEPEKIKVEFLTVDDLYILASRSRGYPAEEMIEWMKKGRKCLGLKYDGEIATFMWISYDECSFEGNRIDLKEDECYLSDMYTVEKYRGRNFATFLKYNCLRILKEMGKVKIYSVTDYFNNSAIHYKHKLKAVNLKLVLYVSIFKIIKFSVTLKSYEKNLKLT